MLFRYWVHILKYIIGIIPKDKGIKSFVLVGFVQYKLGSKGTKGGMTLYHIGYVEIGSILVLLGTIGVTSCDHVV
jgi:hypothetical protein